MKLYTIPFYLGIALAGLGLWFNYSFAGAYYFGNAPSINSDIGFGILTMGVVIFIFGVIYSFQRELPNEQEESSNGASNSTNWAGYDSHPVNESEEGSN